MTKREETLRNVHFSSRLHCFSPFRKFYYFWPVDQTCVNKPRQAHTFTHLTSIKKSDNNNEKNHNEKSVTNFDGMSIFTNTSACGLWRFFTGLLGYSAFLLLRAHTTGPLWREAFTLCATLWGALCHGDRFSRIQNCSGSDVHGLFWGFLLPHSISLLYPWSAFLLSFSLCFTLDLLDSGTRSSSWIWTSLHPHKSKSALKNAICAFEGARGPEDNRRRRQGHANG